MCIPAINNFGKFSSTISPKAWKGMRQLLLLLNYPLLGSCLNDPRSSWAKYVQIEHVGH